MKLKKRRKKQVENKRDHQKKKRRKCGVISGSKAYDKQAGNKCRYCRGCE